MATICNRSPANLGARQRRYKEHSSFHILPKKPSEISEHQGQFPQHLQENFEEWIQILQFDGNERSFRVGFQQNFQKPLSTI